MKLSEAIRLGAMMKPQARGHFYGKTLRLSRTHRFPWFQFETVETSCAIGAAFDVSGVGYRSITKYRGETTDGGFRGKQRVLEHDETWQEWEQPAEWNTLWYTEKPCPQCKGISPIYRLIPHLNDDHRWTREQIADWVEQIENQQEQVLAKAEVVAVTRTVNC